ncbi:MAG: hypothetical protein IT426_08200 [Pirellulales bacterium]|nr:hypothetical protein [Pirellulales bacterium]
MREEPSVNIRLDGDGRTYRPGETLSGEYVFDDLPANEGKTLEVSVVWFTEGKGDEDLAVHEFWRTNLEGTNAADLLRPRRFSTVLPNSPLSYDGRIVKIRWCVRVRAFFQGGKEVFGQKLFRLGDVPEIPPAPPPPIAEPTE